MRQFVIFDTGGDFFAVHGNALGDMLDMTLPDYPDTTLFSYAAQGEPTWLRAVEIDLDVSFLSQGVTDATNDLIELIAKRILSKAEWDYDDCAEGGRPKAVRVDEWVKDTVAYDEAQEAELDEYLNA